MFLTKDNTLELHIMQNIVRNTQNHILNVHDINKLKCMNLRSIGN